MSTYDKKMQKLFEGFRTSLNEEKPLGEGNMKNEHIAIMDRLEQLMSEFRLTTDDVRTILGDMDTAQDYADPSMPDPSMDTEEPMEEPTI